MNAYDAVMLVAATVTLTGGLFVILEGFSRGGQRK